MNKLQYVRVEIADLIYSLQLTTELYREQNYNRALTLTTGITDKIGRLLEHLLADKEYEKVLSFKLDVQQVLDMLQELISVQQEADYVLLADLMELRVQPWLSELLSSVLLAIGSELVLDQELYRKNTTIMDQIMIQSDDKEQPNESSNIRLFEMPLPGVVTSGYRLEYTGGGALTLCVYFRGKELYFHSNQSPQFEGYHLAKSWHQPDKKQYIIYGIGLGFAVRGMIDIDKYAEITVFENELDRLQLALTVQDFSKELSSGRLKIIYDPDFSRIQKQLNQLKELNQMEYEFVLHYPSVQAIEATKPREQLEDYFIQYSSVKNQQYMLYGNFKSNIALKDANVTDLREKFKEKDLYIVAAGPSLDKNYLELKSIKDGIILATGTVLRKLLNAGIQPDYVIITDGFEEVYEQIRGLEECQIPLLYLSTAHEYVPREYKGKRYMILQHEFEPSEEYAISKGIQLFYTGGSVSTTALDIGIQFECSRIIFLGLDLAFTDEVTHASGTPRMRQMKTEHLREIEGISGVKIKTSKNMDSYRIWIEKRIERYLLERAQDSSRKTIFIDATEGGAKVHGMLDKKLIDVIKRI